MILSEPNTDYQTIVSIMDAVRSYKTVVAASLVSTALFPEIALGMRQALWNCPHLRLRQEVRHEIKHAR